MNSDHLYEFVIGWGQRQTSVSTNPQKMYGSGQQAYQQAILFEITGDNQYAENAMDFMRKWSTTLKSYSPSYVSTMTYGSTYAENSPLNWAWAMASWFKAAELLKYTYSCWDKTLETNMLKWFDSMNVAKLWDQVVLRPNDYTSNYSIGNWHYVHPRGETLLGFTFETTGMASIT
jgi:hypothetical protein